MKKLIIGLLLVVVLLMIGACKTESDEVAATKVAKSFFEALDNKDFKTAKTYATAETQKTLDFIEMMMSDGGLFGEEDTVNVEESEESEEAKEEEGVETHEILSVKVDGDKAVASVKVTNSNDPDNPKTDEVQMLKEKGTWKVHMTKE